ncbi:hypothetical protein PM082_011133 [Marasmius tenuissimus]|nr:hypothetical protein PM082_011133 [Marasmius tenuissimus]
MLAFLQSRQTLSLLPYTRLKHIWIWNLWRRRRVPTGRSESLLMFGQHQIQTTNTTGIYDKLPTYDQGLATVETWWKRKRLEETGISPVWSGCWAHELISHT